MNSGPSTSSSMRINTVELSFGTEGRVGHHWRIKWALSGYHRGEEIGSRLLSSRVGSRKGRVMIRDAGAVLATVIGSEGDRC